MTSNIDRRPSGAYRCVTAALGLVLLGCGIYLSAAHPQPDWMVTGAGLLLTLLGANALYAAIAARPAWVARIGPLP